MPPSVTHRQLLEPGTLAGALRLLRDEERLVPMAGCTDLYVLLNFGTLAPTRFLNLWPLDELRGIERRANVIRIGALTTYTDLIRAPIVRRDLPMLAAAAREVGGVQIQNRGTLGGNVANGSPAGDTLPVLAAAEAVVELRSASGVRQVPFRSFYTGYRETILRRDELIAAFEVPRLGPVRQYFRKVGSRAAQAISKVVMAGTGGARPRVAFGSVGPTVVRLPNTEAALAQGLPIAEAQRVLLSEIAPIDDLRSTAEYRRRVAANLLAEFWAHCGTGPRRAPVHRR
ncbi:MAG: carbon monoxide dehydrogenase [Luteitalea sp.]|nr:carbon monoxide dehydrogenase [Luteitalea sp.]